MVPQWRHFHYYGAKAAVGDGKVFLAQQELPFGTPVVTSQRVLPCERTIAVKNKHITTKQSG